MPHQAAARERKEMSVAIASNVRQHMENSSWIRRMFELGIALKRERGEENVFDLSLGNPIVEPPSEFFDALRNLADAPTPGAHRYMPNAGYPETRQAVADTLSSETGLPYAAQHVLMTCGAAAALNVAIRALCDPGDEVVVLTPYFAEYLFYPSNHGAVPVVVGCDEAFTPDLDDLERKLTPRSKVVILNSPNNPAGVIYPQSFVADLAALLRRKSEELGVDIYLISDEPYRRIIYDGLGYPFPQHEYERTITATSHAKDLALPGDRIGYLAVHPGCEEASELMDAFTFCNRVLGFVNAPAIMQHLVRGLQHVTVDVSDYQEKRDYLCGMLTSAGYNVRKPEGAFYLFPQSPVEDEMLLIQALQEEGVLVVPGRGFGMPGYFRISYCVHQSVLEGAEPGFRAAMSKLSAA